MEVSDFGVVECCHWQSADHVRNYQEKQGIASMLAFQGQRCVGQLYLQEYDPAFRDPKGWIGHRPFADFQIAEPLGLNGRFLTLGCYHVGWRPDWSKDESLWGRGIGTALLRAVITWYHEQHAIDGLMSWGLVAGSHELLQWMGQMPHTVYRRFGFQVIKALHDPRIDEVLGDFRTPGVEEDRTLVRVMLLTKGPMRT